MTIVVSAAIVDRKARRILLAQRAGDASTYPWFWCSPGGKVNPGETHRDTLTRELCEEIDIDIAGDPVELLYCREVESQRNGEMVPVYCYVVFAEQLRGKPSPRDATCGLAWFDCGEVTTLRLTPADNAEIDRIVKLLNSFAEYSP
jgi:8-oxo-dGTP diphosphatase